MILNSASVIIKVRNNKIFNNNFVGFVIMNFIRKAVLLSLCLLQNSSFLFSTQENVTIDLDEDVIILCNDEQAEIYPLDDVDTICSIDDIQNYIDDLEFDPMALPADLIDLPCAPADIVILGQGDVVVDDADETEAAEIVTEHQIQKIEQVVQADQPDMPIILAVDFTDTSFEAQDVDEYHESDYLLPEPIEEIVIDVQDEVFVDKEMIIIDEDLDEDQLPTEVVDIVVVVDEVASAQTEAVDTVQDSKKKAKKGFFGRSKKIKIKNYDKIDSNIIL